MILLSHYLDPLYRDNFQIIHFHTKDAGPHSHDFLELGYITQNSGIHGFADESEKFCAGNYFIVDRGADHYYKSFDGKGVGIINCLFKPEFFDKSLHGCTSFSSVLNNYLIRFSTSSLPIKPINRVFTDDGGYVRRLLDEMLDEYQTKPPGYFEFIRCNLIKIILVTMRKICVSDDNCTDVTNFVLKEIEKNSAENISLSEIAERLHFSLPYLSRKFKNDTGKTFSVAVKEARIENACRILANSDENVANVAAAVGYNDLKTFYTVFREFMGVSPNTFRKTVKK